MCKNCNLCVCFGFIGVGVYLMSNCVYGDILRYYLSYVKFFIFLKKGLKRV